jgi:hypothetical protein
MAKTVFYAFCFTRVLGEAAIPESLKDGPILTNWGQTVMLQIDLSNVVKSIPSMVAKDSFFACLKRAYCEYGK